MSLRAVKAIQRAHDILQPIVTGEILIGLEDKPEMQFLRAALDVLCWVLKHEHNTAFAEIIQGLEGLAKEAGYELVDLGRPQ